LNLKKWRMKEDEGKRGSREESRGRCARHNTGTNQESVWLPQTKLETGRHVEPRIFTVRLGATLSVWEL
jgi:hypothetical protein